MLFPLCQVAIKRCGANRHGEWNVWTRRNHFTELFHIDHGKIRDIHAAFYYAPEDRPAPNWPPYDGLYPLPAAYHQ